MRPDNDDHTSATDHSEQKLISAGIVLFNPDIDRLSENIKAVINQVDLLILVDNHSDNIATVEELFGKKYGDKIVIIRNSENLGIAKALNQIVEYSYEKGYDWVLTLDQDSIYPENGIEESCKYLDFDKVGIIAPYVICRGTNMKPPEEEYEYVFRCITSGSLTNVKICREVGSFDDRLFIDYVDYDFCMKLKINGYRVLRVNTVTLLQNLGNNTQKVNLLGKTLYTYNHSPWRNYHYVKNGVFYMRKYGNHLSLKSEIKNFIVWEMLKFIYEKEKVKKFTSAMKGLKDGLKMKI